MKPATWPVGVRVPRNREQALKQGWAFSGWRTIREGELQGFYEVTLRKRVGAIRLTLTLPYRVNLNYGRPRDPRVKEGR